MFNWVEWRRDCDFVAKRRRNLEQLLSRLPKDKRHEVVDKVAECRRNGVDCDVVDMIEALC